MPEFWKVILSSVVVSGVISAIVTAVSHQLVHKEKPETI